MSTVDLFNETLDVFNASFNVLNDASASLAGVVDDLGNALATLFGLFLCFTQVGYLYYKCGSSRCTDVLHISTMAVVSVVISTLMWWFTGYGITFGSGAFGGGTADNYAINGAHSDYARFMISLCYASMASTLMSGTATGRMRLGVYCFVTAVVSGFIFPVAAHWCWSSEGWLAPWSKNRIGSGFIDAGPGVANMVGGSMTFAIGLFTGARAVPSMCGEFSFLWCKMLVPHDRYMQGTGLLLHWAGWMFFNVGGVLLMPHDVYVRSLGKITSVICHAAISSCLVPAAGTAAAILVSRELNGFFRFDYLVGSAMAGLSMSGSCGYFVPLSYSPLLGLIAAGIYYATNQLGILLRIDDVFNVVSVHWVPSIVGCLLTPFFAESSLVESVTSVPLSSNRGELFGVHLLAVATICLWSFTTTALVIFIAKKIVPEDITALGTAGYDTLEHDATYGENVKEVTEPKQAGAPPCHRFSRPSVQLKSWEQQRAECRSRTFSMQDVWVTPQKKIFTMENITQAVRFCVYLCILAGITSLSASIHYSADTISASNSSDLDVVEVTSNDTDTLNNDISTAAADMDKMWVLICATIVFSMQLGFCFLEAGGVRSGNVINIIFKNLGDCAIGGMCWWLTGYSIAYSEGNVIMGTGTSYLAFSPKPADDDYNLYAHFFLSFTYMTTAVTIVSGAVAERISLVAYYTFVVIVTSFTYPIIVHIMWSSYGWLSPWSADRIAGNGILDFAGSAVIHLFGGSSALTFSYLIGPRKLPGGLDIFSEEGMEIACPHNRFLQSAGTLLLWFAWFAFNSGSVIGLSGGGSEAAATASVNTILSSAISGVTGMIVCKVTYGKMDIGHICNSILAGLVSITAGCAYVSPIYSLPIGIIGVGVYFFVFTIRRKLLIDDVVDAVAVHLGGGAWGTISVGLFADAERIRMGTGESSAGGTYGLFLGGGWTQLGLQVCGVCTVMGWCAFFTTISYFVIEKLLGSRVDIFDELRGLDVTEHCADSYDYIQKIEAERLHAEEAVTIAQRVSEAMVKFDLEEAKRVLGWKGDPSLDQVTLLKEAMRTLVGHLAEYRPYLPNSLFMYDDSDDASDEGSDNSSNASMRSVVENRMDSGLKTVKIAAISVQYSKGTKALTHERIQKSTEYLIGSIEVLSKQYKGMLQTIEGGKLVVTWVTKVNCLRVASMALRVVKDLKFEQSKVIASGTVGKCLFGNVGTARNKFTLIIGELMYKNDLFGTVGDYLDAPVVAGYNLVEKLTTQMLLRPIDRICGGRLTNTFDVYEIESAINLSEDGWMYDADSVRDWFPSYKAGWTALKESSFNAAIEHFEEHLGMNPNDIHAKRLLQAAKNKQALGRCIHLCPFSKSNTVLKGAIPVIATS